MKKLEEYVRSIPDFPEPGIIFRDVTSVLQDADGLHLAIDGIMEKIGNADDVACAGTVAGGIGRQKHCDLSSFVPAGLFRFIGG